ncbi:MAG TPA: DinB family protein [Terriglobales bacterium]|jgi:hypothetical protein
MTLAADFGRQIEATLASLHTISEDGSRERRYAGAWSRREILGHLLDSAVNNHNRFVRAALDGSYSGPGYAQKEWVALHGYHERPWGELVELWAAANLAIAQLVARIPAGKLQSLCVVGSDAPVTLEFLITDYLSHIRHHVAQLELASAATRR